MNVKENEVTADAAIRLWIDFHNMMQQLSEEDRRKVHDFAWEERSR